MPPKSPLTTLLLRYSRTTLLLPITPSTNLDSLLSDAFEAIKATADPDAGDVVPSSANELALWTKTEDGEGWERLDDKGKTADKWGVYEADELAVSFRTPSGKFPEPHVERPVDEEGDLQE